MWNNKKIVMTNKIKSIYSLLPKYLFSRSLTPKMCFFTLLEKDTLMTVMWTNFAHF